MRKRSVNHIADTIFWYTIYLFPLICYVGYLLSFFANPNLILDENTNFISLLKFSTFVSRVDIGVYLTNSFIYSSIGQVFASGGIFPLFTAGGFLHFMATYVVVVTLLHLIVDFLVFIPRLAMKWLNYFTKSED